ncbi:hypothetical protein SNEBB_011008 [Seison nebaliae]|nr:hypothetical protein SNEBB_011008 [Seison nebaliae]
MTTIVSRTENYVNVIPSNNDQEREIESQQQQQQEKEEQQQQGENEEGQEEEEEEENEQQSPSYGNGDDQSKIINDSSISCSSSTDVNDLPITELKDNMINSFQFCHNIPFMSTNGYNFNQSLNFPFVFPSQQPYANYVQSSTEQANPIEEEQQQSQQRQQKNSCDMSNNYFGTTMNNSAVLSHGGNSENLLTNDDSSLNTISIPTNSMQSPEQLANLLETNCNLTDNSDNGLNAQNYHNPIPFAQYFLPMNNMNSNVMYIAPTQDTSNTLPNTNNNLNEIIESNFLQNLHRKTNNSNNLMPYDLIQKHYLTPNNSVHLPQQQSQNFSFPTNHFNNPLISPMNFCNQTSTSAPQRKTGSNHSTRKFNSPRFSTYSTTISKKNLFITGLPEIFNDEQLRSLCGIYGEIISSKVIYNKINGKCKGFAFCEFAHESNAIFAMNDIPRTHHHLSVEPAKHRISQFNTMTNNMDKTNVYIQYIPYNMSNDDLRKEIFRVFPSLNIGTSRVINEKQIAFIRVPNEEACKKIIDAINSGTLFKNIIPKLRAKNAEKKTINKMEQTFVNTSLYNPYILQAQNNICLDRNYNPFQFSFISPSVSSSTLIR